jgi:BTB/POZ domain
MEQTRIQHDDSRNTSTDVSPRQSVQGTLPAADMLRTKYRHRQRHSARDCATDTSCLFDYQDDLFVESARRTVQYLHEAWLDQVLCDLLLVTADGHLLTHKTVLTACSPSLDTLYRHQQLVLQQEGLHHAAGLVAQLDLTEFSMDSVADIVNFAYTGDIELDNKNIGQVTACSRELDIGLLVRICRKYLIDACDPYNVILHYSVAANNEFVDLRDRLMTVICEAFTEVSKFVPKNVLINRKLALNIVSNPIVWWRSRTTDLPTACWNQTIMENSIHIAELRLACMDCIYISPSIINW